MFQTFCNPISISSSQSRWILASRIGILEQQSHVRRINNGFWCLPGTMGGTRWQNVWTDKQARSCALKITGFLCTFHIFSGHWFGFQDFCCGPFMNNSSRHCTCTKQQPPFVSQDLLFYSRSRHFAHLSWAIEMQISAKKFPSSIKTGWSCVSLAAETNSPPFGFSRGNYFIWIWNVQMCNAARINGVPCVLRHWTVPEIPETPEPIDVAPGLERSENQTWSTATSRFFHANTMDETIWQLDNQFLPNKNTNSHFRSW